jgi:heme-degrading monooxygenase HmoA
MIVEFAPIRLAPGKTEADLVAASGTFQQAFLAAQPGFVRRELLRKSDGEFIDIVHWRSAADAEAIMHKAAQSEACALYFSVMQMPEDGDVTAGVEHLASVAIYG